MPRRHKPTRKLFAGNGWFDQLYRPKHAPGWKPPTADEIAEFLGEPTKKQKRAELRRSARQRSAKQSTPRGPIEVHPGRYGYDPLDNN